MEKYKVRFKVVIGHFSSILFGIVLGVLILMYYRFFKSHDDWHSMLWAVIIVNSLFLMLNLVLCIQYFIKDRSASLTSDTGIYTYRNKGSELVFRIEEINTVIKVLTYSKARGGIQFVPWSTFGYFIVQLKDGREFVMTSLLICRDEVPIFYGKPVVKKLIYPLIFKGNG